MAATATTSAGPWYASEDPALPKRWKGLVDGRTGYFYFSNHEAYVSRYDRPKGSAPPLKASTVLLHAIVMWEMIGMAGAAMVDQKLRQD